MKARISLFIGLVCLSFSLSAGHLITTAITWKTTSDTNIYEFYLTALRDCQGVSAPSTASINGPYGSFTVTLDPALGTNFYSTCLGSTGCQNYEVLVYKNTSVTLAGVPSATGWEFSTSGCCMYTLNNITSFGYFSSTTMYPVNGGKPKFSTYLHSPDALHLASNGLGHVPMGTIYSNPIDSIVYTFGSTLTAANTAVTYNSGFSNTLPLPDQSENAQNGTHSINRQNGLLIYDVQVANSGPYLINILHEFYVNGQIAASVPKDIPVFFENTGNTTPQTALSVNGITYSNGDTVFLNAYVGDTLQFNISATDSLNPNGKHDLMTAYGNGKIFTNSGSANYAIAQLNSLNTNGTLIDSIQNDIQFEWVPVQGNLSSPIYNFIISFKDDGCPALEGLINFVVNLSAPIGILEPDDSDTVLNCGSTINLEGATPSGQYDWQPNSWVSNSSIKQPSLSTGNTGWLYLYDPASGTLVDSIYVQTPPSNFTVSKVQSTAVINDTLGLINKKWFLNGVPFSVANTDSLELQYTGDYSSEGYFKTCKVTSNTLNHFACNDFAANLASHTASSSASSFDSTIAIDFNLVDFTSLDGTYQMNAILVYGIENSSQGNIKLSVYDENESFIWWTQSLSASNLTDHSLVFNPNFQLTENTKYILTLEADTGVYLHYYKNVAMPFTVSGICSNLETTDLRAGLNNGTFPNTATNRMPAIALSFSSTTNISESTIEKLRVYPNPVNDKLFIEFEGEKAELQILDSQGKLVKKYSIDSEIDFIDVSTLPCGIYFLKHHQSATKFIKE